MGMAGYMSRKYTAESARVQCPNMTSGYNSDMKSSAIDFQ